VSAIEKKLFEPKNLIRNPLGIIGLFLVLVEAIAAFVIVQSTLSDTLNAILVLFLVLFPGVVLYVFYSLVTKHHEKLYSPSDYKDEANFVSTYNSATQQMEFVKEQELRGNIATVQTKEGMREKDITLILETLNDILNVQKTLIAQKGDVSLVEKVQSDINKNMNTRIAEKRIDHKYRVEVLSSMKESAAFVSALRRKGYSADIYKHTKDTNAIPEIENEAIWLGSNVPFEMAIDVIREAKSAFPHLKYMELSDSDSDSHIPEFVHNEIFIGGASETAKERQLKEMKQQDFDKLDSLTNLKELHSFVNELRHR